MTIKDQSGVDASGEWLRDKGHGTYNARTRKKSLEARVTEPITFDHWQFVVDQGQCLACGKMLVHRQMPDGGTFNGCEDILECKWYISWRVQGAEGVQVKL